MHQGLNRLESQIQGHMRTPTALRGSFAALRERPAVSSEHFCGRILVESRNSHSRPFSGKKWIQVIVIWLSLVVDCPKHLLVIVGYFKYRVIQIVGDLALQQPSGASGIYLDCGMVIRFQGCSHHLTYTSMRKSIQSTIYGNGILMYCHGLDIFHLVFPSASNLGPPRLLKSSRLVSQLQSLPSSNALSHFRSRE